MALCSQVVDFVRLNRPEDPIQRTRIVEVAIDQLESGIGYMRVLVNRIDSAGVKRTRTADDSVHLVPFREEKLGEVGSVLPADAGNEGFFTCLCDSCFGPAISVIASVYFY